jgi:hypothetical protein
VRKSALEKIKENKKMRKKSKDFNRKQRARYKTSERLDGETI